MKIFFVLTLCFLTQTALACLSKDISIASVDPIDGVAFELNIKAYVPKTDFDKQVIILPSIGGVTTLEAKYASKICARGAAAYVFVHWSGDMEQSIEDLAVHNRGTLRGLHAVESFLKQHELPTRILGTSLGGIYSGIAAGKFDLIEKVAIIASGTNLSQIMATSTLADLVELKKKRYEYHRFNNDNDYAQEIKKYLMFEANTFKDNLKNKELLFIRTNSDRVIAPTFQDQLISLFTPSLTSVYYTKYNHKRGIIMAYLRRSNTIANFLAY